MRGKGIKIKKVNPVIIKKIDELAKKKGFPDKNF
jgi:hypothetical protein